MRRKVLRCATVRAPDACRLISRSPRPVVFRARGRESCACVRLAARRGFTAIAAAPEHPRVGLVLGAGGVLGGAWLVGALDALAAETGWDPGSAERIVGTSAGSMIGALVACGVPPWLMAAHSGGEDIEGVMDAERRAAHARPTARPAPSTSCTARCPRSAPGSWKLALGSLARPYRHSPVSFVSRLAAARVHLDPAAEGHRPARARLRGRLGAAPRLQRDRLRLRDRRARRVRHARTRRTRDLADAVAASCAIPGFYHPVEIDGRRYVDGGMRSTSNLDALAGERLDVVICLNPMSSLHAAGAAHARRARSAFGMRAGRGQACSAPRPAGCAPPAPTS